jgi:hypothetical protein
MEHVEAQRQIRRSVLILLYNQRYSRPEQPGLLPEEIEDALSCSRQRLDFNLWFLREVGVLDRTESGHYQINARGVEAAESLAPHRRGAPLLPPSNALPLPDYKHRRA